MTKKIEAIIREERLEAVKAALTEIGIVGLNITPVRGRGRDGGITIQTRNGAYMVDMIPKVQINIVLSDDNVEATIDAICNASATGSSGDGVIFVLPVDDVIRISTGERGRAAITYQGDIDQMRQRQKA
ncbi:MAG: P-II family nitrogen regulator [Anaerolineae bacterium]|jgi:nitrogen regulatory protein P-II 1|nr:P-II family nitrogen regulator [Anaerolineae bacterium]